MDTESSHVLQPLAFVDYIDIKNTATSKSSHVLQPLAFVDYTSLTYQGEISDAASVLRDVYNPSAPLTNALHTLFCPIEGGLRFDTSRHAAVARFLAEHLKNEDYEAFLEILSAHHTRPAELDLHQMTCFLDNMDHRINHLKVLLSAYYNCPYSFGDEDCMTNVEEARADAMSERLVLGNNREEKRDLDNSFAAFLFGKPIFEQSQREKVLQRKKCVHRERGFSEDCPFEDQDVLDKDLCTLFEEDSWDEDRWF